MSNRFSEPFQPAFVSVNDVAGMTCSSCMQSQSLTVLEAPTGGHACTSSSQCKEGQERQAMNAWYALVAQHPSMFQVSKTIDKEQ